MTLLAGFTGGSCGGGTGGDGLEPREDPVQPPPPPLVCQGLEEAACVATQGCQPTYVEWGCACAACEPNTMCPPCDCPDPATGREYTGCVEVDPCEGLDETQCLSTPGCTPAYGNVCALPANGGAAEAPVYCDGPGCGCPEEQRFLGCYSEPLQCEPVLCDLYCEFGFATNERGCAICACNPPPPDRCYGLDERTCAAHPECEPIYGDDGTCTGDTGLRAPCQEGESCDPPPPCNGPTFRGCAPRQPHGQCDYLGERECLLNPTCVAEFRGVGCAEPQADEAPCADPTNCRRPAPPMCEPIAEFVRCHDAEQHCPAIACPAIWCEYGHAIDPNGCPTCECLPGPTGCDGLSEDQCVLDRRCEALYVETQCLQAPPCADGSQNCTEPVPPCGEKRYAGCTERDSCRALDEMSCGATPGCSPEYIEICDGGGATGGGSSGDPNGDAARPCSPETCPPPPTCERRFAGCHESWDPGECRSDADCPNGYCEMYATCAAIGCPPPPPARCVYADCNDGSQLICRALQPECAAGEVAAIRNGCWECVDARTCGVPPPPPPPPTCANDSNLPVCSRNICDDGIGECCFDPVNCVAVCIDCAPRGG